MKTHPAHAALGACLALMALLAQAGRAVSAQDTHAAPTRDTFGIQNPGVPWRQGQEGAALNGACYGIARLTVVYQRLGLGFGRPLRAATTPGGGESGASENRKASDRLFLEQAAALAQNYALRDKGWSRRVYSQSANPPDVERSLRESRPSPENPQILWLNRPGGAHAVIVDGREEVRALGQVVYRVRDPNDPDKALVLTYSTDRRTFSPFVGRSGTYETIRHDRSVLPEQNQKWVEAVAHGLASSPEKRYLPVWRGEKDVPLSPDQYQRMVRPQAQERPAPAPAAPGPKGLHIVEPPAPSTSLNGSISGSAGNEGGIRLYFDPAISVEQADDSVRWGMLADLVDLLTGKSTSFLVQAGGEERLEAVPLGSTGGDDIGGLTRILGYVFERGSGDVYVLGQREPGRKPISLDTLTLMLRAIWRQGSVPAISLDPNPDDFFGPQQVRIEGVPPDLRRTAPIRTMLEADYAMKRINLGDDDLSLPGFASHIELLRSNPEKATAEYVRFWLYPKENAGAEVLVTKTADGEVARFPSDVRLLTETMKRANDLLVGTGQRDEVAEETCDRFTAHYPQIARARPVFQTLQGVFDAAKLAHVLRVRGIRAPVLDRLADRRPAQVALPASYPGTGPKLVDRPGGSVIRFIGGGAVSSFRPSPADQAAVDLLPRGWRSPGDGGPVELSLPGTLAYTPAKAGRVDASLESSAALGDLVAGRVPAARARVERVLARDPNQPLGRLIRGLCRAFDGDDRGGLADMDVAVKTAPPARIARAVLRLRVGDTAGAVADVRATAGARPSDAGVLAQKARIELWAGNLAIAQQDIARLARLDPLEPQILDLRSDLRVYRALGPELMRRYIRVQVSIPLGESLRFSRVTEMAQSTRPTDALALLRELQARYAARRETPGEVAHLADRVDLLASELLLRPGPTRDVANAQAALARVRRRHPKWPTPLLIEAEGLPGLTPAQRVDRFRRALALKPVDDVLHLELSARYGSDVRAFFGIKIFFRLMEDRERRGRVGAPGGPVSPMSAEAEQMARLVQPLLTPGPVHTLMGFMSRFAALARRATPPDEATGKRVMREVMASVLATPAPVKSPGELEALGVSALFGLIGREALRNPADSGVSPPRLLSRFAALAEVDWISEKSLEVTAGAYRMLAGESADLLRRPQRGGSPPDGPAGSGEPEAGRLPANWEGVPPFLRTLIRHALLYPEREYNTANRKNRLESLGAVVRAASTRMTAAVALSLVKEEQAALVRASLTDEDLATSLVECERMAVRARLRSRG